MQFYLFISVLFLGSLFTGKLFQKIRLPELLGVIGFAIIFQLIFPGSIPPEFKPFFPFIKSLALAIILLRAGFGIDMSILKQHGKPAVLMSFLPSLIEGSVLTALFWFVTPLDFYASGMIGFIIAAVSPAVVIPSMLKISENLKESKKVTTIILAGASIDDIFAITMFSVFLSLAESSNDSIPYMISMVPVKIFLGAGIGFIIGVFYNKFKKIFQSLSDNEHIIILLAISIMVINIGEKLGFASYLSVMFIGIGSTWKSEFSYNTTKAKLKSIWLPAQILLFFIIGVSVDLKLASQVSLIGIALISIGLIFRSIAVLISTYKTSLNKNEQIFCVISYIPKATVQAAFGGVALSKGNLFGNEILAYATLSIIFTAPIGLLLIETLGVKLLSKKK